MSLTVIISTPSTIWWLSVVYVCFSKFPHPQSPSLESITTRENAHHRSAAGTPSHPRGMLIIFLCSYLQQTGLKYKTRINITIQFKRSLYLRSYWYNTANSSRLRRNFSYFIGMGTLGATPSPLDGRVWPLEKTKPTYP